MQDNWELSLAEKYVVSIAGLVDINKIANRKYVVSIAGLVDINKIVENKAHWGDLIANWRVQAVLGSELATWLGILTSKKRKLLLYLSWSLGWKESRKRKPFLYLNWLLGWKETK